MKLRPSYERKCSSEASNSEDQNTLTMQASSGHAHQAGNINGSSASLSLPTVRSPAEGSCNAGEVVINLRPANSEGEGRPGSRHTRPTIRLHSRHGHTHSNSNDTTGQDDPNNTDNRENGNSISEVLHVYQWLSKSFPYILIFSAKLLVQHLTGISVGIGLLTTFLYANKCIVNQVFLRDKCSKIQCIWLLFYLSGCSVLLYYIFSSQALYYSLIFLNPTIGPLQFWDVLWVVGITDFIVKFIFMGLKCLVLLVPSFIMSHKCKGYWYMCLEEIAQYYCMLVSTPVWFRYLIDYGAQTSGAEWHFGVLLALLYLIIKLFVVFGQWKASADILRLFCTQPSYGAAASNRQCSEVDDICAICQAEFKKPTVLLCQHIFCQECISLWLNREKTCPMCRTAISSHIHKWKDGATSLQLRLF
ncbi:PREDICTED: RING finger and transmembrane domain-containing protein 1 [Nanorana parkeri]|uniref:RING finger and transmembrane domain-containing protein 1 n=1 Tax=Nanorana parkeri TaxID=125878 RepID=UPI0008549151|nr:PREDICTED: RING finger and transmembrane domain-containing protein 1 [Nanorana parkeri]